MERAIYSDFELRKRKTKKKREAGIGGPEQSKETNAATVPAAANKSASAGCEAVEERAGLAVVVERVGEKSVPPGKQITHDSRLPAEEIRELVVERLVPNPRLVLASYQENGRKQFVRVFVGVNRNFRPWMTLRAQRGSNENEPWRLVGRRPRLPGRW